MEPKAIQKRYYSELFKIKVVKEIEHGILSKEAARRKYNIKGKSAVLNWCRKYGTEGYPIMPGRKIQALVRTDEKDQKIAELEARLKDYQLQVDALESLIEVANEMYNTDLKKKVGIKRPKR